MFNVDYETEKLYQLSKQLRKLLKRHNRNLVWAKRLLSWEEKFKHSKIKYFCFFTVLSLGKGRDKLIWRADSLKALIGDVERFAVLYKEQINKCQKFYLQ